MPIQILDENTINKIAAGEVIERPSSVVKELVENAIDAKATAITIEIKDGGITFIRVTDNGCGIDKSEIELAFLRHSTSKIRSVEDLVGVASLGFRGEALSSIASVAQVELITKTKRSLCGTRYVIEGGTGAELEEVGAPDGTTFIVRNLFYNTPVRRQFLKTPATEAGYTASLVEHLALSHPEISFRFINNNQNKLYTSGNGNIKDIIYHINGRDTAANLLEVSKSTQDITISGYIGKPVIGRGNRAYENYFINGRYIKSSIITRAIEEAYVGFTMVHKYPFTALHFNIKSELLDVNVHPAKLELRFSQNEFIYNFVRDSLRDVLAHRELVPGMSLDSARSEKTAAASDTSARQASGSKERTVRLAEPFEIKRQEYVRETSPEYGDAINQQTAGNEQTSLFAAGESGAYAAEPKIIGQVFNTYWLIEFEDRLFIMDQHAAHEKILYEKTMRMIDGQQPASQMIAPPVILTLSLREQEALRTNIKVFEALGFEIEEFGGNEYKVTGVPALLPDIDSRELLIEILDALADDKSMSKPELITQKAASMSCKAAVKGNMEMSAKEARHLAEELMKADNPYNCPHGRPTLISISKRELEKKFKRIV